MDNLLQELDINCKYLIELDADGQLQIRKSEFEQFKDNNIKNMKNNFSLFSIKMFYLCHNLVEEIINKFDTKDKINDKIQEISWNDFKKYFISFQKENYGLEWVSIQGNSGPIKLKNFELTNELKSDLLNFLKDDNGNTNDFLLQDSDKWSINDLFEFIDNLESNDKENIIKLLSAFLSKFLDQPESMLNDEDPSAIGMSESSEKNEVPQKNYYNQTREQKYKTYKFSSETKGENKERFSHEVDLGNKIIKLLELELKLNEVHHVQTSRSGGAFENPDFFWI